MSNNPRPWGNFYHPRFLPGREMPHQAIPMMPPPMQQPFFPPPFQALVQTPKISETASDFAKLFADDSEPKDVAPAPHPVKPSPAFSYRPPVPIVQPVFGNTLPVIGSLVPPVRTPTPVVENKTPIQMSFIDAIAHAKEKSDDQAPAQKVNIVVSDAKKNDATPSLKAAVSGNIPVSETKVTVSKGSSTSEASVSSKNEQAPPVQKTPTPYKVQKKRQDSIPRSQDQAKVKSDSNQSSSSQPAKKPVVEQITVVDEMPKKRFLYEIMDMMKWRNNEESKKMPEVFSRSEGQDRYLRTFKSQKRYSSYTRSKDGWVITKDRLSKMDKSRASTESIKIVLQKTLNKITKASFDKFIKEFLQQGFATPEIADILVDRIFCAVGANNPCIEEFAQLIKFFDSFYRQNNNDSDYFVSRAIAVFNSGSRIKPEWLTKYNQVLNRATTIIDELDEKNEELQMLEQSQRYVLTGSAKILGYLMLKNIVGVKDALAYIQSVSKSSNELEIETLCVYLKLVMPTLQKNKHVKTVVDDIVKELENNRKAYQMRLRYIILDLVTLHKNNWNVPKPTVTVTTKNILTLNKDNIMAPNRTPTRPVDATKGIANNPFSSLANKTKVEEPPSRGGQRYRDRSSKQQKVDSQSSEPKAPTKINVEKTKAVVFPILDDFATDFDYHKITYDLKDLEVTSHMNVFVNVTLQYLIEKFNTYHVYYGHVLHFFVMRDRVNSQMLLKGLKKFMKGFNVIVEDLPIATRVVARIITPLIVSGCITIIDYYNILVKRNINNIDGCITSLIETIAEYVNDQTAREIIRSSQSNDVLNNIYSTLDCISTKHAYCTYVTSSPSESPEIYIDTSSIHEVMKSDELNTFIRDFVTLIHYCCPPWEEALKKYISGLCKEHAQIFTCITSNADSVRVFTEALKQVFDRAHKQPSKLFVTLFDVLVRNHKLDVTLIRDIINEFEDDTLDAEMFELGKVS